MNTPERYAYMVVQGDIHNGPHPWFNPNNPNYCCKPARCSALQSNLHASYEIQKMFNQLIPNFKLHTWVWGDIRFYETYEEAKKDYATCHNCRHHGEYKYLLRVFIPSGKVQDPDDWYEPWFHYAENEDIIDATIIYQAHTPQLLGQPWSQSGSIYWGSRMI